MNIQHLMGDCFCHETLHEKILMELNEFLLTSIEHVGNGVGVQEFAEEGQVLGVKELNLHLVQDLFALKAIDVLFDQMMRKQLEEGASVSMYVEKAVVTPFFLSMLGLRGLLALFFLSMLIFVVVVVVLSYAHEWNE